MGIIVFVCTLLDGGLVGEVFVDLAQGMLVEPNNRIVPKKCSYDFQKQNI
ncbi:MAG: hypothetical protein MUE85_12565 [Microscillaceae bacterium]|nr:hypothetical protein [Microscillaceae bacterium]